MHAEFGCYTCSNAKSNEECNTKGKFVTCSGGQNVSLDWLKYNAVKWFM